MNLDDLIAVWKSQDAAPLHGVNRTLLQLALRDEEAKREKARRRERWIIYGFSAGVVVAIAIFLGLMSYASARRIMSGWDFVMGGLGVLAAVLSGAAMYFSHRAQVRREQAFGDSLRDQLRRGIVQMEDAATRAHRTSALVTLTMGGICPAAILLLTWRINQKAVSDDGYLVVTMILLCFWSVGSGVWELRRSVRQDILPRQRRLEALLKEIDT